MRSLAVRRQRRHALAAVAVAVAFVASCAQSPASTATPAATAEATGAGPTATAALEGNAVITADPTTEEVEGGERGVARSRTVSVDTSVLPGTAAEAAQKIELSLFDDTTVVVELDTPEFRPEMGYRTWSGTIDGDEGSAVVLVEQDGLLSGVVNGKDGTFRLRSRPDGSTQIEQIDQTQFPSHEDDAVPAPDGTDAPPAATPGDSGAAATAPDTNTPVVDVLVGYTSAALTRAGGQAAMDADIALVIEQTNTAFATSGIDAAVRLVHTTQVTTNGPVDGNTLGKVRTPDDGVYDELNIQRDEYGADLVALIVDNPGGSACGIAYLMNPIGTGFASNAVSVTDLGCATGNFSFTHELGHNFGAAHDRGAWAGTPALPYGYDWVNPTQKWRTVMAYTNACAGCTRLLRFSNPDQTFNGAPLGASASAANAADNRAVLNATASTVVGFRGAPMPASLTLASPAAGDSVAASGKLITTWSTSGYMGPFASVELLRGSTVVKALNAKVALGTGRFEYALPLTTARGDDYRIRVTPLLAPQYAATSKAFTVSDPVLTPSFTLTSAAPGGTGRVTWTYTGAPGGTVKVELLKDDKVISTVASGAPLGAGGAGGVDVTLPAALNDGGGYRFRTTPSATKVAVLTDEFSVASSRRLVVTSPTDGVTGPAGQPLTVTWTASGEVGPSVKAELVKGDLVLFTSGVAATSSGTLTFTPPAKLPMGEDYRIRLLSGSFATVVAASEGLFSLDGSAVTVTSQDRPSSVTAGRPVAITWTTTGVPGTAVKLEAVAPGRTSVVIASSVPLTSGSYTWTVPLNVPKGDWTIRATVVGNTLVADTSGAPVTVAWPEVSVSGPTSAAAGAPVTVSWAFTEDVADPVAIKLMQGTKAVLTLATRAGTAADGTGSLTYTLPVTLAPGSYPIQVTSASNAQITTISANPVTVTLPTLSMTHTSFDVAGDLVTVSWQFSDAAAVPVRIRLMQGSTAAATLASSVKTAGDGTGSASYRLPINLAPGTYSIEVSAVGSPGIVRTGAPTAVTRPALTASGASSVARGQTATISWSFSGGASAPVTITLVQGTKVVTIKSGAMNWGDGSGSFVWTAPATLTPGSYTLRIRPTPLASSAAIEGTQAFVVS